jgi:hypothetical protein
MNAADPRAARELLERGYTVFERAYDEAEVAFFRERLVATWTRIGRPSLASSPPSYPAEDVEIGPAGMVVHKLTRHYPETAPRLYKQHIIDTLREVLGPDMYLELPAGALSDSARPFFDWHCHIDGVDDAYYRNKRPFPAFDRSHRVTHILYLDDLSEENGQLLVHPRRITDPTSPPFDPRSQHWDGEVVISCPRGSVVVIEQCTWHAARRKLSPGVRAFVGSYFAARGSRLTPLADPALADWSGDDALFRSVLPPR